MVAEHAFVASGLAGALQVHGWQVASTSGPTTDDIIDVGCDFQPRCVLIDVRVGGSLHECVDLIESIVDFGGTVLLLTAERRRTILAQYLEAGASGWVDKQADVAEVHRALVHVAAGGSLVPKTDRAEMLVGLQAERDRQRRTAEIFEDLSEKEALVLAALADGLSADEIARDHFVSVTTVRSQIRAVLRKLDVHSQLAAVAMVQGRRDLLPGFEGRDRRRLKAAKERHPASQPAKSSASA